MAGELTVHDLRWDEAFVQHGVPESDDGIYAIFARAAAHIAPKDISAIVGVSDEQDLVSEMLDSRELGTVGIGVNDEPIWVSISRLTGGTVVGRSCNAFETGRVVFVLQNPSLDAVEDAASNVLHELLGGADVALFTEGEEEPEEGIPAEIFGFEQLRVAWQKQGA